jgi:hypothetical protein
VTHEEEIELGKELALYAGDPLKFVMDMFPWDSDPQLKGAAPEQRQRQLLEAIRDGLPEEKVRIAVASGHGAGLLFSALTFAVRPRDIVRQHLMCF